MGEKIKSEIKNIALWRLRVLSKNFNTDSAHDVAHLQRVSELTQLVGEVLNYNKKEKLLCFAAAWFHDLIRSPSEDPSLRDEIKSARESELLLRRLHEKDLFKTSIQERKAVVEAIKLHTNQPIWFKERKRRNISPSLLHNKVLLALYVADYIEANGAWVIARRCSFVGGTRLHTPFNSGGDLQQFGFIPGKDEGLVVALESILRLAFINPEMNYPDYLYKLIHPLYGVQREFVLGLIKGLNLTISDLVYILRKRKMQDGRNIFKFRGIKPSNNFDKIKKLIEKQGGISDRYIREAKKEVANSALETVNYFSANTYSRLEDLIQNWKPKGKTTKRWRQEMLNYQTGRWLADQRRRLRN